MLTLTTLLPRLPAAPAAPVARSPGRPHCPCGVPLTLFYCLPPRGPGEAYRFTTHRPAAGAADRMWAASVADLEHVWNEITAGPPHHACRTDGPPDWYIWGACSPDLGRAEERV